MTRGTPIEIVPSPSRRGRPVRYAGRRGVVFLCNGKQLLVQLDDGRVVWVLRQFTRTVECTTSA